MRELLQSSGPDTAEIWKKELDIIVLQDKRKVLAIQIDSVIMNTFDIRNSTKHIKEF